jgi:hypothetical protein
MSVPAGFAMDFESFRASLAAAAPPPDLGPALEALWFEAMGDWERAHTQGRRRRQRRLLVSQGGPPDRLRSGGGGVDRHRRGAARKRSIVNPGLAVAPA